MEIRGVPVVAVDRQMLMVFVVYVVCGWAGIEYASIGNGSLTMIWLPSGISLAACMVYGRRIWPAIWLGSFVANTPYLMDFSVGVSLFQAVLVGALAATINTRFQALMAYALYQKHIDDRGFYSGRNIVHFVSRVILPPTVCNISLLVILYSVTGYWELRHPNPVIGLAQVGFISALSDLHGYFVIVPMVACFRAAGQRRLSDYLVEHHVFVALSAFAALMLASFYLTSLAIYLFIPLGVFIALKIGVRAATLFLFSTSMVLTFATAQDTGPFAYTDFGYAYTALLLFIFSLGLPVLLLAAETRALKQAYSNMEDMVRERTRKLDELNKQLEVVSRTDMVTGVANRRYLDERLQNEWLRARRHATPISLILIDIDCFKEYNDHYGHLAGDAVLARVAGALRETIKRPGDFIARYGGEEFVIILPDTRQPRPIADRCRSVIENLAITHEYSTATDVITVSVGYVCLIPESDTGPDVLVDMADKALYAAKGSGRNRVIGSEELSD